MLTGKNIFQVKNKITHEKIVKKVKIIPDSLMFLKEKTRFKTEDFRIEERKGRKFAVAQSPNGDYECWKVLSKAQAEELEQ